MLLQQPQQCPLDFTWGPNHLVPLLLSLWTVLTLARYSLTSGSLGSGPLQWWGGGRAELVERGAVRTWVLGGEAGWPAKALRDKSGNVEILSLFFPFLLMQSYFLTHPDTKGRK